MAAKARPNEAGSNQRVTLRARGDDERFFGHGRHRRGLEGGHVLPPPGVGIGWRPGAGCGALGQRVVQSLGAGRPFPGRFGEALHDELLEIRRGRET
jgi:hypothetical protein